MFSITNNLDYIPESLRHFLKPLITNNIKLASIGQEVVQACRTRDLIVPLQLGLGVQMYHHFGSRFLIDSLYRHGFCSSYSEVQLFERNAAMSDPPDISCDPEQTLQFVADNVDHNTCTLDGNGTFHGMGIIATISPEKAIHKYVQRNAISCKEVSAVGSISIRGWIPVHDNQSKFKYLSTLERPSYSPYMDFDTLWKTAVLFRRPRPLWSGLMQTWSVSDNPGKASVHFLPMIDMNPSDMTYINSTLLFIQRQAKNCNHPAVITFDQPLYWKALQIITSDPSMRNIVLRLGGFHMMRSFLGTIGHLMAQSGLHEVLDIIYASNVVSHILSGKATSRAVRAHIIVSSALYSILGSRAFGIHISQNILTMEDENVSTTSIVNTDTTQQFTGNLKPSELGDNDIKQACTLYEQLLTEQRDNVNLDEYKPYLKRLMTNWKQQLHFSRIITHQSCGLCTSKWLIS